MSFKKLSFLGLCLVSAHAFSYNLTNLDSGDSARSIFDEVRGYIHFTNYADKDVVIQECHPDHDRGTVVIRTSVVSPSTASDAVEGHNKKHSASGICTGYVGSSKNSFSLAYKFDKKSDDTFVRVTDITGNYNMISRSCLSTGHGLVYHEYQCPVDVLKK